MDLLQVSGRMIVGGVVLLTIGMAVAILGIVAPSVFYPGVFGIAGGLIVIAAGAILRAARADIAE